MPARPVSSAAPGRFRWHPDACLHDTAGPSADPVATTVVAGQIAPWPPVPALCAALALAADGAAFRIGPGGPVDGDGARQIFKTGGLRPMFETGGLRPMFKTGGPRPVFKTGGPRPMFETLTSGSSGAPRRIRRTQHSWIDSFEINARLFGIGAGAAVAVLGRLEHSLALYGALEALHLGAGLHLLAGLRPDRQVAALAARGIGVLYATPVQLRLLVEAQARGLPPVPGLRHVLVGGAKFDHAARAACKAAFPGATVREFYGAAETSFIALADNDTPEGAVGRPYPGVEISVRDDGDTPVPDGTVGRIWVRSPYLFAGYASGAVPGTRWRDNWLTIGEHGALCAGQLYLAGRESRMVTIADQNVFPEEVEAFLLAQPGVARAAVLAQPDARRGHVLQAVIMGNADATDVLAACRAGLGALKAPRRVVMRQDWPLLPSGKTDLAELERALT